jgi:hypothetical protein
MPYILMHVDDTLVSVFQAGRAGARSGMENENVAPGPSLATAHSRPWWLSMIDRLTDKPMPIPVLLVV